jgi:hypothetical protein
MLMDVFGDFVGVMFGPFLNSYGFSSLTKIDSNSSKLLLTPKPVAPAVNQDLHCVETDRIQFVREVTLRGVEREFEVPRILRTWNYVFVLAGTSPDFAGFAEGTLERQE